MPDQLTQLNGLLEQVDQIVASVPQNPSISEMISQLPENFFQPVVNTGLSPVQALDQQNLEFLIQQAMGNPEGAINGSTGNILTQISLTYHGAPGVGIMSGIMGGIAIQDEGMIRFNQYNDVVSLNNNLQLITGI